MRFLLTILGFSLVACSGQKAEQPSDQQASEKTVETTNHTKEMPTVTVTSSPNYPADFLDAVNARVDESQTRLEGSPAGKIVWGAIENAGGLKNWFKEPIAFRFNYAPLERDATDTFQVIDPFNSKARHVVVRENKWAFDADYDEFGWDGKTAWSVARGNEFAGPRSPRFWALTPYYFVGMPFVLADPGVVLHQEKDAVLEGVDCHVIHVSFEAGTGDAPDDYYVVYFDKQTRRVKGLRYVVSYKGFFKDGGHSPEKLMVYEGTQIANGLTFATAHPTYKWDGTKGEKVTDIEVSDLEQSAEYLDSFFEVPKDAKVLDGF